MVHGIFISFRKSDPQLPRERLYQALVARFGVQHVFKAGPSIPLGSSYPDSLIQEAGECEIMLVLIGPGWLGDISEDGTYGIHRREDWVRREVAEAMRRGKWVIPVLMGDGQMLPAPEQLPEEIRTLCQHQCVHVPDTGIDAALAGLIDSLINLLPALGQLRPDAPQRSTPGPPPPSAHQEIHGDGGTNLDNTGGTIHAEGHGTVEIGGTRNTTVNNEENGGAAKTAVAAGLAAYVAGLWGKARTWLVNHPKPALGTAVTVITAAGLTTLALTYSPQPSAAPSDPATVETSADPTTQAATPIAAAVSAVPTTPTDSPDAGPTASDNSAAVANGTIPAAGTDVLSLRDGNANAWNETFSFDAPVNGASADQNVVDYLAQCVPSAADVPTESAFIPVRVTYDLTSAEPINHFEAGIGASNVSALTVIVYKYSDGTYGCNSLSGASAEIQFNLLRPNAPQTITAWVVILDAYNGQGQPNTSAVAGVAVGGSTYSAAAGATILSASGPDICGDARNGVLVTGLKPSQGCATS